MRNNQLSRTLALIRLLSTGSYTLLELATALHVTTRTIRRDLEVLSVNHVPVRQRATGTLEEVRYVWFVDRLAPCPICHRSKAG